MKLVLAYLCIQGCLLAQPEIFGGSVTVEPGEKGLITATLYNNGKPCANHLIIFTNQMPICHSGYHEHDACSGNARPTPILESTEAFTNYAGQASVQVLIPAFSGQYPVNANAQAYNINATITLNAILNSYGPANCFGTTVGGGYYPIIDQEHALESLCLDAAGYKAFIDLAAHFNAYTLGTGEFGIIRCSMPSGVHDFNYDWNPSPERSDGTDEKHLYGIACDIVPPVSSTSQAQLLLTINSSGINGGHNCTANRAAMTVRGYPTWHVVCNN